MSNMIELIILVCSIPAASCIVASSNRKVKDLDGFGSIVKEESEKGVVAQL